MDYRVLTPIMGHELLHTDKPDSVKEEIIANAVPTTLIWGKLLLQNPKLAQEITPGKYATQFLNLMLFARLNSRSADGKLTLLNSTVPGRSFVDAFSGDKTINTPGNANLDSETFKATGKKVKGSNFDDKELSLLDQNQIALSPVQIVQIMKQALLLDVPATITG